MINKEYKKYKKSKLIELLQIYEEEIDLLDIILNEMSEVTLNSIQAWLDYLQRSIEEAKNEPKSEDKGVQITIFDALKNLNSDLYGNMESDFINEN